jgi:hypothetical protein
MRTCEDIIEMEFGGTVCEVFEPGSII